MPLIFHEEKGLNLLLHIVYSSLFSSWFMQRIISVVWNWFENWAAKNYSASLSNDCFF